MDAYEVELDIFQDGRKLDTFDGKEAKVSKKTESVAVKEMGVKMASAIMKKIETEFDSLGVEAEEEGEVDLLDMMDA